MANTKPVILKEVLRRKKTTLGNIENILQVLPTSYADCRLFACTTICYWMHHKTNRIIMQHFSTCLLSYKSPIAIYCCKPICSGGLLHLFSLPHSQFVVGLYFIHFFPSLSSLYFPHMFDIFLHLFFLWNCWSFFYF